MSEIKDTHYAAIGGTVGRIFQTKNGAAFELHRQDERMRYPDRITVWGLGDQVAEGDRVEVHGWYSDQVEEYTKRDGSIGHGVKRTLNAPKLVKHEKSGGGFDGSEQPF